MSNRKIEEKHTSGDPLGLGVLLLGFNLLFFGGFLAVMMYIPLHGIVLSFTGESGEGGGTTAGEAHGDTGSEVVVEVLPPSPGQAAYAICASCHGAEGQGNEMMHAPALAGQDAWYLKRQLLKFKDGQRGTHADDVYGAQMRPMAQMLVDEAAIDTVVDYIATLPTVSSTLTLGGDVGKGQVSYALCMACHGAQGEGNKALNAPRLTGLPDWYIVTQLKHFKSGARGADPKDVEGLQMRPMAITVPDEATMQNIAAYIHSLEATEAIESAH